MVDTKQTLVFMQDSICANLGDAKIMPIVPSVESYGNAALSSLIMPVNFVLSERHWLYDPSVGDFVYITPDIRARLSGEKKKDAL
jgi:hypothetical protein